MSNLIVPNINCFQTQKQLATLNNVLKYVHVILCVRKPLCVHVACTFFTIYAIC